MGGDREWTLIGQLFPTFVATLLSAELVSAASIETTTQLCASCHGEHGLPSDPTVPIIWGQQAAYIQTELNAYRNGDRESQIMSSIAESLSNAEMSQIAAYFGHAQMAGAVGRTAIRAGSWGDRHMPSMSQRKLGRRHGSDGRRTAPGRPVFASCVRQVQQFDPWCWASR
jgi:cytochrome c553